MVDNLSIEYSIQMTGFSLRLRELIDAYNCIVDKFNFKTEDYKIMGNQMESMMDDISDKVFLCNNLVRDSLPIPLDNQSISKVNNLLIAILVLMEDYREKLKKIKFKSLEITKVIRHIKTLNDMFSNILEEEIKNMKGMEVNKRKRVEENKVKRRKIEDYYSNEENNRKNDKEKKEESENICDIYYQIKMSKIFLINVEKIMKIDFKETVCANEYKIADFYNDVEEIVKDFLI